MTQIDIEALVEKYVTTWGESDPVAHQNLLKAIWQADGLYIDPINQASNRAALDNVITHFLEANPGAKFTVNGKVDHHHDCIRFYWTLRFANGSEASGMDYGEVTPDGKLCKIVGFF
ncbi:MAG: nuclear transport factor 2 family protein [Chloroflexi bacterium]|nr:nuclear transport factor 2 family protein [Chloroflexota bacterium]